MAVDAHPRALVHRKHLPVDLVVRPGELGRRRLVRKRRHVVDPLTRRERVVRVQVVRLPERARVGGQREAADRDPVPDDPGHEREDAAGEDDADDRPRPVLPADQERAADQRQEEQARVAEDRQAERDAEDGGQPERPPAGEDQHEQDDRGGEELVEDLAVLVDVVPDEIRVQGGDDRRRPARPASRRTAGRSRRRAGRCRPRRRSGSARPPTTTGRRSSRSGSGTRRRAAASTRTGGRG